MTGNEGRERWEWCATMVSWFDSRLQFVLNFLTHLITRVPCDFDLISHNRDLPSVFLFLSLLHFSFLCVWDQNTVSDTVNTTNNSQTHVVVHANRLNLMYIIYADHMLTAWMHITSSQSHACVTTSTSPTQSSIFTNFTADLQKHQQLDEKLLLCRKTPSRVEFQMRVSNVKYIYIHPESFNLVFSL